MFPSSPPKLEELQATCLLSAHPWGPRTVGPRLFGTHTRRVPRRGGAHCGFGSSLPLLPPHPHQLVPQSRAPRLSRTERYSLPTAFFRERHVRLERRVTAEPYLNIIVRCLDEGAPRTGEHSTALTVLSRQNHHTDHRERAASVGTAEPTSRFELDLRFLWMCWQWK